MKIQCPLCSSQKSYILRSHTKESLGSMWMGAFGINPFIDNKNQENKHLYHCQCSECDLRFYFPIMVGDSSFYENLSMASWYYEEQKWEFTQAIQILNQFKNIENLLEIGCGKGYFLEKVCNAYQVTGIELNNNAVQICRQKNLNVLACNLDTLENKFDSIVLFEVLEHLDNPGKILEQIDFLLKRNGILIIAVPNPESYLKEFDKVLLDMPPHHVTQWGVDTFSYISQKYNLELINIYNEPLRYVHYKYYINMLESKGISEIMPKTILQKIKRKILNVLESRLISGIKNSIYVQGYEYHKKNIIGQTHLVVFKKS